MELFNTFQKFVGEAANNLGATSGFKSSNTEVVDWGENKNPPSDEELNVEINRLKAEYDANQYQRDRAEAYPSWQEQMDLIYHKGVAGLKAELKKTKDKFPKE